MRWQISGHNGFIAKHIIAYLTGIGEYVIPMLRYDSTGMVSVFPDCNIIHTAAYGNHQHHTDPFQMIRVNIDYTMRLMQLFALGEGQKFYNFSSSSVTLKKQTPYSITKLFTEEFANSYQDPRFVNIRPYSVFGPGEASHRFIPTVIRCLKSGEQMQLVEWPKHDFIFVESFIDLMFKGVTEIGSGESYSNIHIVKMLEGISGKTLNYTPIESLRSYDNTDWCCPVKHELKIELFEGLKLTYESYENNI